ncbi:putative ORFan [Tupanvirus deep ocean]|uniref:ORFan n=1 Tax=Tupanvirus soda lake TaxID=2126985 RepID=A0AC59HBS9_9VIRU|nr:putative ORFan [Tupanvirus deep ocean]AUL78934.2 putative ORFan [Tupanvirus deep ocean]
MEYKRNNRNKKTVTIFSIGIHMDSKNTPTKSIYVPKRTEKPKIITIELKTPMARYVSGIESLRCESDIIVLKTAVSVIESQRIAKLTRLFFQYYKSPITNFVNCINEVVPLPLSFLKSENLETLPKNIVAMRASFGVIPIEILAYITSYLQPSDIFRIAQTCKSMYCLMTSNCFMKQIEKYILNMDFKDSDNDYCNKITTIASIYPRCKISDCEPFSIHKSIALSLKHKLDLDVLENKRRLERSNHRRAQYQSSYDNRNNRHWYYRDYEDSSESDNDEVDLLGHDLDEVELERINDVDDPDYDYEYERFLQQEDHF